MWQGHFQGRVEEMAGGLARGGSRQSRCQCKPQKLQGMMGRVPPEPREQELQITGLPLASLRRRKSMASSCFLEGGVLV